MTTAHVSPRTAVVPVHAVWGAAAGLVGGMGMGVWMSVSRPVMDTAMITMVAGLLGSTNAVVGWLVHLAIALFAGTGFGVLLGRYVRGPVPAALLGLAYGVVWWVLGALWILPANMGRPVFAWNAVTRSSLGVHLVFGLLTGLAFFAVARAAARRTTTAGR
ncbi:hypothetical protein LK07_16050 [Streptomyces pluripotens]|uniref:DUF1440 domain-containing protein n=1 Tax=Streptomyces pluripotens TaxID=1355015 RepID=A0A221P901_9ACTN|nr:MULTISPECIES: hypothetical protein [Streptomyces]ARP74189.1 hypothetical protein LK06_014915 [Streptomyces pluripotens]ASN28458.1 hypothetical protein LK07_16050 [Streptomyces pluripotens]KIE26059.1 hypothetical protein LK08_15945 [Streptomyces sp. MUSC 125]MCH0557197.1 hypothetical protein [Streptomyces sp. MUM 16J]